LFFSILFDFFAVLLNQIAEWIAQTYLSEVILTALYALSWTGALPKTPSLKTIVEELDLIDIWRRFNPLTESFTFHSLPHSMMTHIDYLFMSNHLNRQTY
uniref:Uncharacterized protein n=1 Tax=Poecilia latipinna TaxID=48699 RepID=A0A3B3UNS7_9TELE